MEKEEFIKNQKQPKNVQVTKNGIKVLSNTILPENFLAIKKQKQDKVIVIKEAKRVLLPYFFTINMLKTKYFLDIYLYVEYFFVCTFMEFYIKKCYNNILNKCYSIFH